MKAPEEFITPRLTLRRPRSADVQAVFERFASDAEVTRYVAWPRHRSIADTEWFIGFSDEEWLRNPGGPYLIFANESRQLLGSTGFAFETPYRVSTGYVLARDAWGKGIAVEAMQAIASMCQSLSVIRLYALCHAEHRRSARVLERSGFDFEGTLLSYSTFPNLDDTRPQNVLSYSRVFTP